MLSKLRGFIVELDNFSGADECEIEGISEQHNIFALVVIEADLLEALIATIISHAFEVRCGVLNSRLDVVVKGLRESSCLGGCEEEVAGFGSSCGEALLEKKELSKGLHL